MCLCNKWLRKAISHPRHQSTESNLTTAMTGRERNWRKCHFRTRLWWLRPHLNRLSHLRNSRTGAVKTCKDNRKRKLRAFSPIIQWLRSILHQLARRITILRTSWMSCLGWLSSKMSRMKTATWVTCRCNYNPTNTSYRIIQCMRMTLRWLTHPS